LHVTELFQSNVEGVVKAGGKVDTPCQRTRRLFWQVAAEIQANKTDRVIQWFDFQGIYRECMCRIVCLDGRALRRDL
jgi:hypothetical protein